MLKWLDELPAGWVIHLALLRLSAQWRSLLTIVIGVLLTAVIGANVPLYTSAIAQVGMLQRLEQQPLDHVHILTRTSLDNDTFPDLGTTWDDFDRIAAAQFSTAFADFPRWVSEIIPWGETTNLTVVQDGADTENARLRLGYYGQIEDHVEIIDGEWPTTTTTASYDLEIALPVDAATALGAVVGDQIVLDQRGWESSVPIRAHITALVDIRDPANAYWLSPSPLDNQTSRQWAVDGLALTPRENVVRVIEDFIPDTAVQNGWRVLFDHTELPFSQIPAATAVLDDVDNALSEELDAYSGTQNSFVFRTELPTVLRDYAEEVVVLGAPFGLILLQLGALVLFFVVTTAALVRRGERREIAMLQSRGVFDSQIILLRGVETVIITVIAILLAPTLSRQLLIWLVPLFTGIAQIPLPIERDAYVYAGGAALLALVVLIVTLLPLLRLPLIQAGGSATRGETQPWWQRYYLDIVLVIVGLGALWQLTRTNTLLVEAPTGGTQVDPLVLLAPALLFVGLGSLSLRVFPFMMNTIARYFASTSRIESVLAGWQVSREPLHYGRITFLLALAIGIGWFAITFQSTINRSQRDQATYANGADIRLVFDDAHRAVHSRVEYDGLEQVQTAALVTRFVDTNLAVSETDLIQGELLAVEADTFPETVYWRDDLNAVIVPEQPFAIPETGYPIPPDTTAIRFYAYYAGQDFAPSQQGDEVQPRPWRLLEEMQVYVRLRDAVGNLYLAQAVPILPESTAPEGGEPIQQDSALIEPGEFPDWIPFQTDVSQIDAALVRVDGIVFSAATPGFGSPFIWPNTLRIASLELINSADEGQAVDWLSAAVFVADSLVTLIPDTMGMIPVEDAPDGEALSFEWLTTRDTNFSLGLMFDYPELVTEEVTIPVVASARFAEINNLTEGQLFRLFVSQTPLWFQMEAIVDYYPTLYDNQQPYLIVDRDLLHYALERRPVPAATRAVDELWLRLEPGVNAASFADENTRDPAITAVVMLEDTLQDYRADLLPLGLIGLLFLSFLIGLALSIVSLLTYIGLAVQTRRSELAVLRALGLPSWRITLSVAVEQILVMLTAVALGVLIGVLLSNQVLPTLSIDTSGGALVPPFIVQTDSIALLQYGLILLAVFITVLVVAAGLIRRLGTAQNLRMSEE
ncbi:MAG: hypothetical protein OHK0046_48570 [Anaerolineae bacterium]